MHPQNASMKSAPRDPVAAARNAMPRHKSLVLVCGAFCFLSACGEDLKLKRLETDLAGAGSQNELNLRSHELNSYVMERLVRLEERIEKSLEGEELKLFRESAAAWRVYLDTEVRFEASTYEGGSIQPLMANSASIRLIAERTNALSERASRNN